LGRFLLESKGISASIQHLDANFRLQRVSLLQQGIVAPFFAIRPPAMNRLVLITAFLVLLTGCRIETTGEDRQLERAQERLEEAQQEASELLQEARRDASRELSKVAEKAESKLAEAREKLQNARERVRDAADDAGEDTDEWSREARREAEDALEEVGIARSIGQVMEDVGRALQNEEGVEAVEPSRLRDMLPGRIEGLDRYDTNSDRSGRWGVRVSHVKGQYANDDGDHLSVVIADLGTLRGLLSNSQDLLDAATSKRGDDGYSRTTRINGYPARISRDREGRVDEFDGILVVGDRFVVVIEARGDFDDDVFQEIFDALPLRRLASLSD
jgi:ElaB/YqjD/DUF883 family membrane-anchored ribosome-binding protein